MFGSVAGLPGIQNGHKLEMERTTTIILVPFQPLQSGRNKLRHALSGTRSHWEIAVSMLLLLYVSGTTYLLIS